MLRKRTRENLAATKPKRAKSDWNCFFTSLTEGVPRHQWPSWDDIQSQWKAVQGDPEKLQELRAEARVPGIVRREQIHMLEQSADHVDASSIVHVHATEGVLALPSRAFEQSSASMSLPDAFAHVRAVRTEDRLARARLRQEEQDCMSQAHIPN